MSKARAIPRWPTAMATSLGLHLLALLVAISWGPGRSSDPKTEVEVLPVQVEVAAALPTPELDKLANSVQGAGVAEARRGSAAPRVSMKSRTARPAAKLVGHGETPPAEPASVPAAPGLGATDAVVIAKLAAAQAAPAEQTGSNPVLAVVGPRSGAPRTVAPAVGDGLLAINPNDARYQPTIPQPLRKPGASFLARLKFCVGADGSVDKVTVVTSAEPALDSAILEKARLYRFHPYLDRGRPIPFCFYREYRLSIRE